MTTTNPSNVNQELREKLSKAMGRWHESVGDTSPEITDIMMQFIAESYNQGWTDCQYLATGDSHEPDEEAAKAKAVTEGALKDWVNL